MIVGQKNEFSADTRAYPRYTHLRRQLISLFPRVNRTLERNRLTSLITKGQEGWQYITKCVEACISKSAAVAVYVFASQQSHIDGIKDDLVRDKSVFEKGDKDSKLPQESMEVEEAQQESLSQGKFTRYAPEIIVYIKGDSESIDEVEAQTAILPEIQKDHLVIYDVTTKKAKLYRNFRKGEAKLLSQNIEFLLEENVIYLLEDIVGFIKRFVPRFDDPFSQGVPTQITSQLQDSLVEECVLKDFLPGKDDDNFSPKEMMETDVTTSTSPVENENQGKKAIFHQNIRTFLALQAKCLFCDLTSKRLGIPGAYINQFMGEGFFDFIRQFQNGLTNDMLPALPDDGNDLRSLFRGTGLGHHCYKLCKSLIPAAETFVQKMYTVFRTLKKIQFETFGLLQLSPKAVTVTIPKVETIQTALQNDLLGLDYVVTCGTLYGVLTVVAANQIKNEETKEIHDVMEKHKVYQYEIAITDGWQQHDLPKIKNGFGILSTFKHGGKEAYANDHNMSCADLPDEASGSCGTLGCFVKQETENELFAVTCYHCVDEKYFIDRVDTQICGEPEPRELGVRCSFFLKVRNTFDIALIKVSKEMRRNCDQGIKSQDDEVTFRDWKFSERTADSKDLERCSVYKKGLTTETTEGVVVGSDFKIKNMEHLKRKGFSEQHNIFIEIKVGSEEQEEQIHTGAENTTGSKIKNFSEDGDSGSVVCTEVNSESAKEPSTVEVISLLCGSITLRDPDTNQPTGTYSYSCQLRGLLTELNKKTDSNIKID